MSVTGTSSSPRWVSRVSIPVMTGKVDHPAGMARLQLRRARDRLELSGFTFSSVHHNAEIVTALSWRS
ncbi:hypothetical protein H7U18_25985 [Klebsiella pneumoniae]|uniref:Uncharacterized protein n=1 Tax=Klebsiella pneumoniae TaxID=573 RepID=A0A923EQE1_KLEPN|nr:hypothetical protein [Klebsiella pneumoniae]